MTSVEARTPGEVEDEYSSEDRYEESAVAPADSADVAPPRMELIAELKSETAALVASGLVTIGPFELSIKEAERPAEALSADEAGAISDRVSDESPEIGSDADDNTTAGGYIPSVPAGICDDAAEIRELGPLNVDEGSETGPIMDEEKEGVPAAEKLVRSDTGVAVTNEGVPGDGPTPTPREMETPADD